MRGSRHALYLRTRGSGDRRIRFAFSARKQQILRSAQDDTSERVRTPPHISRKRTGELRHLPRISGDVPGGEERRMATGDLSGNVPAQSGSSSSGLHRQGLRALIASALCLAGAVALQADMTGLSRYEAALKETSVARQISALEHFISVAGSDPLKTSALEYWFGIICEPELPRRPRARPMRCWRLIREMRSRWRRWLTQESEGRRAMAASASRWRRAGWPSSGACKNR